MSTDPAYQALFDGFTIGVATTLLVWAPIAVLHVIRKVLGA